MLSRLGSNVGDLVQSLWLFILGSLSELDCFKNEEGTGQQQDDTSDEKDNEEAGVA